MLAARRPRRGPAASGRAAARPARAGLLSRRLGTLAARLRARPETTIGELLDGLGPAGFALALLVLAVPAFVPVPLLPTGVVCGALLALLAPQVARVRARRIWAPASLRRRGVPAAALAAALERAGPVVARVEAWLKPRRLRLLSGAAGRLLTGIVLLVLAVALAVPVPFGNAPPAAAIVALAVGLATRDGVALLAGLGLSAAAVAWVAAVTWGFVRTVEWGFGMLP